MPTGDERGRRRLVLVSATVDRGVEGVWAEEVLARSEILALHHILVEATNILRRLERTKEVAPLEAAAAHRDLMLLGIDLLRFEPFAERVWELRRNVASYDTWYVAIAERTATCSFKVTVVDNPPPGITGCPSDVAVSTGPMRCTTPTMPAGASAQFTLFFQIDLTAPPGAKITSAMAVSSANSDPVMANNDAAFALLVRLLVPALSELGRLAAVLLLLGLAAGSLKRTN
jgi:predicted nucleic acid-binding protein